MPWNAPRDRAEPAPSGDKLVVGRLATIVGGVMAVEGVLCGLASLPFLVFGGFGVLGLLAGMGQCWAGLVLIGAVDAHPKGAAIGSAILGLAIGFFVFGVMVFFSCASIVNCGGGSIVPQVVAGLSAAAINLLGAVLLWKRKVQPQG